MRRDARKPGFASLSSLTNPRAVGGLDAEKEERKKIREEKEEQDQKNREGMLTSMAMTSAAFQKMLDDARARRAAGEIEERSWVLRKEPEPEPEPQKPSYAIRVPPSQDVPDLEDLDELDVRGMPPKKPTQSSASESSVAPRPEVDEDLDVRGISRVRANVPVVLGSDAKSASGRSFAEMSDEISHSDDWQYDLEDEIWVHQKTGERIREQATTENGPVERSDVQNEDEIFDDDDVDGRNDDSCEDVTDPSVAEESKPLHQDATPSNALDAADEGDVEEMRKDGIVCGSQQVPEARHDAALSEQCTSPQSKEVVAEESMPAVPMFTGRGVDWDGGPSGDVEEFNESSQDQSSSFFARLVGSDLTADSFEQKDEPGCNSDVDLDELD
jgi:hypothetical protein